MHKHSVHDTRPARLTIERSDLHPLNVDTPSFRNLLGSANTTFVISVHISNAPRFNLLDMCRNQYNAFDVGPWPVAWLTVMIVSCYQL